MREPIPKPPKRGAKPPKYLKQQGKVAKNWNNVRRDYLATRPADHTGYWICDDCHRYTNAPEVDHIIKRSVAPDLRYEFSNLQILCHSCHQKKDGGFNH